MKVAALDLGSNTFLLLIAEVNSKGEIEKVFTDECHITRLAEGVNKTHVFSKEALKRANESLRLFSSRITEVGVDKIQAVATSAARDAKNSEDFFSITNKYNIPVDIISGSHEASLTYSGALGLESTEDICVIDVGGGSTEIIGKNKDDIKGTSINLGSVRLTEMFITQHPTPWSEVVQMHLFIEKQLAQHSNMLPTNSYAVVAVAGTPTTLAAIDLAIEYSSENIEGYVLPLEKIKELIETLSTLSLEERLLIKGMDKGREDVILAGASILYKTSQFLGVKEVRVSTKGVRFGLASQMGKQ